MNIKSIIWGAALLTLCGCAGNNADGVNHYDSFDKVIAVQTDAVEVPPVLLYPRALYLLKDQLIAMNAKTDTIFYAFSLPDLKLQKQFGVKGQGPNDFNMINGRAVKVTDHTFTIVDGKNLKTVDMTSVVPQVTATPLPGGDTFYNGLIRLNDSLFAYEPYADIEKEYRLLRGNGEFKDFGDYPEAADSRFQDVHDRNNAYSSWKVAKPDGTRIAQYYQRIRRYRIYDAEGTLLSDNVLDIQPGHEVPALEKNEQYTHTFGIHATDRYIYTLNYDMTRKEMKDNPDKAPNLQIFTWDGKPVKQYQLDKNINTFTIDEERGLFYGVFFNDEGFIYTFALE